MRAFDVLFDVGGDLRKRLLAGVLLRDVNEGAVLAAQLAKVAAALERVRAGAAEHGDHLLAGIFDPRRAVERVEAHAVVRVVHNDGHSFVTAFVDLHPSVRARLAQPGADKFLGNIERHRDRDGGECVGYIK